MLPWEEDLANVEALASGALQREALPVAMLRAAAQTAAAVLEEGMPLHPAACKTHFSNMFCAMQDHGLPHALAGCAAS